MMQHTVSHIQHRSKSVKIVQNQSKSSKVIQNPSFTRLCNVSMGF
jgi:hypothetical protein